MKNVFTKEVKIALVAIVGIILLFFGMKFLKGLNLFDKGTRYYITFKDVSGLSASSPIYADGYKIGTVKGISYDYSHSKDIVVEAEVDRDMRIPMGSSAEIVSDMMGNTQVNLLLANNPRERVEAGGTIPGNINAGALGEVKNLIPTVQQILPKLDSIMASLNALLADPALAHSLHNVETITSNLTVSSRELNTLMGQLNKHVPGMLGKANHVLDNTNKLTANLAAVDVEGTMREVNNTLAGVQAVTSSLNKGLNSKEGTLGLLMNDPGLYNNLNGTMRSADSLLTDLKAHPKRYVHFSLFGKKDK